MLAERALALGMTVLVCAADEAAAAAAGLDVAEPARVYARGGRARRGRAGGRRARTRRRRTGGAQGRRPRREPLERRRGPRGPRAGARRGPCRGRGGHGRAPAPPRRAPLAAAPHVLFTSAAEVSTVDARRRAGVSVAEQVAAVLRGRLAARRRQRARGRGDDADELMPYMDLCSRLGRLLVQLAGEPVDSVEITYGGSVAYFDTRLLTLGVLGGVLADRAETPVNFVNAEGIAAGARRPRLARRASRASPTSRGSSRSPSPARVAPCPSRARRSAPSTSSGWCACSARTSTSSRPPHMAFLRYVDAPGIGGKVGTLLGEWGVNIGHMSVGRGKLGDEAVMALTLDESLSEAQTAAAGRPLRPRVRPGGRTLAVLTPVLRRAAAPGSQSHIPGIRGILPSFLSSK